MRCTQCGGSYKAFDDDARDRHVKTKKHQAALKMKREKFRPGRGKYFRT